ncbi:cation-translocating P-type ATPase [Soehngenia longivitae]|uniref:P-type Ca(2+) transporter n=1 Tax=Soehngenia longivitae TaxID=2562294 RepID=A0A4Z0D8U7_9FIRM|nr:cation-translocating P-type ATPase [Soehngenia longivitae]TFZ41318.1 cation-translocating P-type ATPase [Soehngenia longivitae]
MNWYNKSADEALKELNVDPTKGLDTASAKERLEKYGANELKEEKGKSFFKKLLAQFSDFLVLILIAAALVSFFIGETQDSIVIIAIVIVNAMLGLYQEGKAEKALDALKKMASPTAKVVRDGKTVEIGSRELVPGDIVILETGDIVPADLRIIDSKNLKIEEASLTGESVAVEKDSSKVLEGEVALGDRVNMAYMSTIVTYGRGKGVVVGTAADTEIGKIATMIQTYEDEATPLQKKLNQLGKILGIATILICIVVFADGLIQNRDPLEMFMVSVSLAVAAIPEGLPAIVTIVLAIGMNKMVKRNAIVKKLLAVETLGATSVICTDKTGTLTQNEMTVVKVYTNDKIIDIEGVGYEPKGDFKLGDEKISPLEDKNVQSLLLMGTLVNDAELVENGGQYKIVGDPTEGALVTLAAKGGIELDSLDEKYPRIQEIPFDASRKMMTTFHEGYIENKITAITKGAPDLLIQKCSHILLNGEVVPFTEELKKKVSDTNINFSKQALRVLAVAYKVFDKLPDNLDPENIEKDMIFVGLSGMIDPLRPEAKEAIKLCKKAGIDIKVITGDYKETAFAIAKDLGLVESEDEAMMGEELNKISDEELREVVKRVKVFARVSPEHKVRIVTALKENGEITAMTGDGVNDALAIKKADIGISMGITGTDVAKNTADMILTDDNFASIVSAVEEGRIIFSNIKKFVFFLLSCNIGEILLVFSSIAVFNWPIPLLPIQLLWLNLVTDSFPALALGVEKGEPDIMSHPPRNTDEAILDRKMLLGVSFQSLAIAAASLLSFWWAQNSYGSENLALVRTIVFTTLITAELLRAYSSRSQKYTLFKIGFFSNRQMVLATLGAFALLLVVLYVPFLQDIFYTQALTFNEWKVIIPLAFIPLIVGELSKIVLSRFHK